MDPNELFPAGPLIPHRRRMRLLEWVKRPIEKTLVAEATVNPDWPLHQDGMVSSVISIELVTQAIAALRTWNLGEGAEARPGFLVGVKEATFSSPCFPVGKRLIIQIAELHHLDEYAIYEGQVSSEPDFFCKTKIQVMEAGQKILSTLEPPQRI
jgi:predicted hotdog family 3-hydroxylacyl-ACP dehydratase